jgi:hypothetical protein
MERITKEHVRRRVENLQKRGFDIATDSAYGQDGLSNKKQSQIYSPKTTSSNNYYYCLEAFEAGVNCERARIKETSPKVIDYLQRLAVYPSTEEGLVIEIKNLIKSLNETE